jgi:general stress protein YciG
MKIIRKRGFAAMDPELQRAIASKGGKSAHAQGKAHKYTSEEARIAGRKGRVSYRAKKLVIAKAHAEPKEIVDKIFN